MASKTPNPRCYKCRIGFIDFEGRTAHRRYIDHMGLRHPYQCKECDQSFISVPHVKFHTKTIHDTPCNICGSLCEFECIENGVEMMKFSVVKLNQAECIDSLEKELIQEVGRYQQGYLEYRTEKEAPRSSHEVGQSSKRRKPE